MIWAKVKFEIDNVHMWKDAPDQVDFLRNVHRHLFKCCVYIEQKHTERDIEYLQFKWRLQRNISVFDISIDDSCETIALKIKAYVEKLHPGRAVKVEVLEDGENGAVVE
jgi:hypothetical protein